MKKITRTLLIGLLFNVALFAQTVTTFTDGTPDDDIALDSNGNIYCSNYVGDTVFRFTPTGDMTPFITGLNTPNGLAFNSNDELYVCDGQANTIYKYDIDGNLLNSYPTTGHPSGIIKSFTDETMIFTQYNGDNINRLEDDGNITLISNADGLNGPVGLAYNENGVLYVGNYTDREVYRVEENGDIEYIAQLPTDGGSMPNLGFIAYAQGFLWGTTMGSDKIYKINPDGIDDYDLYAGNIQGSEDGPLADATFHTPNGITFNDSEDTMYITDFGTKNLRIISGINLATSDFDTINALRLYPNPSQNEIHIDAPFLIDNDYSLVVTNILGEQVYSATKKSVTEPLRPRISVQNWNTGIYFLKIQSGSHMTTKKFIKK